MREKIKIKEKLIFFYLRVKFKRKLTPTKKRIKLKIITQHKFGLVGKIKNQ
jgi:hypothetical protein